MAIRFYVRARICFSNPQFDVPADVSQQKDNIQKDILNRHPEVNLLTADDCVKVIGHAYQAEVYSQDVPKENVPRDSSFTLEWFF